MKVLVIQQRMGIGDMVIFLPYVHAISKKFQSQVSLLVKKNSRAEQLCQNDRHIEEVIYLDRNKNSSGRHDGWLGFFKLLKDIKEKKFDKVFIFNGSLRFLLLTKLCGIKSILQYPLFTRKNNIVLTAKKFTEKHVENTISTQPVIFLDDAAVKRAKKNTLSTKISSISALVFQRAGYQNVGILKSIFSLLK